METKITKLPKSQVEIEFNVTAEEFAEHFGHALEHLKAHVKVEGFRPGKAPNKLVEEKLKPEMVLMEAGDHTIQHVYSDYVAENNLEVVGHPEVQIKKIAKGSELIFTAKVTVLPEVELPNYKEIAKAVKGQDVTVTEEEVQDALNYLQKSRAKMVATTEAAAKKDFVQIEYSSLQIDGGKQMKDQFILGEGGFIKGFEDNIENMKNGEEKEFKATFPQGYARKDLAGKEVNFKVRMVSVNKMELPEINDEFAKQMGAFDTLVALKASMKEGMMAEKTENEKQRKRAEVLEKISADTKIEMPDALVEYEKERLMENLKHQVSHMNIPFEEYLASVKQTEEQIKDTYTKEAEKRIRGFLILKAIGRAENVVVEEKEVEVEVNKSLSNYPKDQVAKIDINELKEYTKGVLFNEKVFNSLEN